MSPPRRGRRGGGREETPLPTVVLKLGSSVLRREGDLPVAVHEIYRWWRQGLRVIAVVSAFSGVTDRLAAVARRASEESGEPAGAHRPGPEEAHQAASHASALAVLLAAGERRVAGLLALELERAGVPAQVLDPAGIGLETRAGGLEADPAGLDCRRIDQALSVCPVAVLPGFQAVDRRGVASLLGRGGSDLTAVFVAQRLGGRCRLLKDVPGIFDLDPATAGVPPLRYAAISWEEAAEVGGGVIQPRALAFAHRRRFPLELAAPGEVAATRVGPASAPPSRFREPPPLRVALFGLGTVGQAVYRRLTALPGRFTVAGVVARDPGRPRPGVPRALLTGDPWELLEEPFDVVVEALPGVEPSARLLARALELGRHVVSANKAALAATPELWPAARARGLFLGASAAVGGAVPVLETAVRLRRERRLEAFQGVLSGTCNFVLDRLEAGRSLEQAVAEARRRGLAEADPATDLDGSDAACKLALLARAGFGLVLDPRKVLRPGLRTLDAESVREDARAGHRMRQVARLSLSEAGLLASVRLEALPREHFLAGAQGEENRVLFELRGGPPVRLAGKGAGGRPTAEAVLGDLFELSRLRSSRREDSAGAGLDARQRSDRPPAAGEEAGGIPHPGAASGALVGQPEEPGP